jgi:S1-C subfamily serine protease
MKRLAIIVCSITFLSIFFQSCKSEPPAVDELYQKYNDAVVLIYNEYYYQISIDNNINVYYSPSANKVYTTEEEAKLNCSAATGTGFVISQDGKIITNLHVVYPKFEGKEYIQSLIRNVVVMQSNKLTELNRKMDSLKNYYSQNEYYLSEYEKEVLRAEYGNLNLERTPLYSDFHKYLNIDMDNIKATLVNKRIGIAYNNTFVTEFADLQDCVLIKKSEDENVDLAMIQTKSKKFDHEMSSVFDFSEHKAENLNPFEKDTNSKLKINSPVYMIGYNKGFTLGVTKEGIKSQFTSGVISQDTDTERILYTIPTLHGSSGSPNIDEWGNLVAVNFAKVDESQGFSFGIPVKLVEKFYKN